MRDVRWDLIYAAEDGQIAYQNFSTIFLALFNKNFPLLTKEIKYKRNGMPYLTSELKSLIKLKNNLKKKYAKYPLTYGAQYREIRNRVTSLLRKAKIDYFKKQFLESSGNSKKSWNLINKILKRKSKQKNETNFVINGNSTNDPNLISNCFNDFFVNVATDLTNNLPNSHRHFSDFLDNEVHSRFNFSEIDLDVINKVFEGFKESTPGCDEVPIGILKSVLDVIGPEIIHICNLSLRSGRFPTELKIAKVTPIHKDGTNGNVTNYRPVSVLPAFSKIIEKVVYLQLFYYLNENSLLINEQFGFRPGRSTEMALTYLTKDILAGFDEGMHTVALFMDLSKAFDSIDHSILLDKLAYYGITNIELRWFKSYLEGRSQYVVYNKIKSDIKNLVSSVPQGSILGPLLFIIFINDIVKSSSLLKFTIYADDAVLYLSSKNLQDLVDLFNREIITTYHWLISNKLTLNINKTKAIIFSRGVVNLNGISELKILDKKLK